MLGYLIQILLGKLVIESLCKEQILFGLQKNNLGDSIYGRLVVRRRIGNREMSQKDVIQGK